MHKITTVCESTDKGSPYYNFRYTESGGARASSHLRADLIVNQYNIHYCFWEDLVDNKTLHDPDVKYLLYLLQYSIDNLDKDAFKDYFRGAEFRVGNWDILKELIIVLGDGNLLESCTIMPSYSCVKENIKTLIDMTNNVNFLIKIDCHDSEELVNNLAEIGKLDLLYPNSKKIVFTWPNLASLLHSLGSIDRKDVAYKLIDKYGHGSHFLWQDIGEMFGKSSKYFIEDVSKALLMTAKYYVDPDDNLQPRCPTDEYTLITILESILMVNGYSEPTEDFKLCGIDPPKVYKPTIDYLKSIKGYDTAFLAKVYSIMQDIQEDYGKFFMELFAYRSKDIKVYLSTHRIDETDFYGIANARIRGSLKNSKYRVQSTLLHKDLPKKRFYLLRKLVAKLIL